jgi:threonine dehydrogenase-like Zn-dependent dehydrogenase
MCCRCGVWVVSGIDGGQGQDVHVPLADDTLLKILGTGHSDKTLTSLLTLSDVMCIGYHAALWQMSRKVIRLPPSVIGAVGLCAIVASKRLGVQRIISLSKNSLLPKGCSRIRRYRYHNRAGQRSIQSCAGAY